MKTVLISILTATLLATAPVAPAQADTRDLAGVLAGVVTLGLIAKAINDRNDRNDREQAALATRDARPQGRDLPRVGVHNGQRQDQRQTQLLPEACLVRAGASGPDRLAYDSQCLTRTYARADRLPEQCEWKSRTDRGWRTVYGARCLARAGYEVEDRWARY
jgi:hypothetical protein